MLEKAHGVSCRSNRRVVIRKNDNRSRADEATVGLQGVEIERNGVHARGQYAARRAARQVAVKRMVGQHAAAILVNQRLNRDACGREFHTRIFDTT